ncbi:plasmid partitioning protein RepB [Jannaschia aquimarina]|uniref:ParB_2 protein n=1 Tax=Jannaschia aquimarina TaxID=935700 RepID=A0A0D1ECH4_9RHOB|nr:plasmid partitioning protein RepB [Jannaschia aquimarina]KIT14631.1 Chromosome-partitioning protein ParB [Jannaschia aquimarina]SNT44570.1 chromosome partitioning protein, ParB family [Jannaschia aquimarina]
MTESRKKRLSMLDAMAQTTAPPSPAPARSDPGQSGYRALRGARDAVDSIRVWELDPESIDDLRVGDRIDPEDVADLRDAIEANGQTVPILVRKNPENPERYLLVYGRRRLEAIRASASVVKVRALVATLDDAAAVRAQISENMARRDLSFIEKALFARSLMDQGYGTQKSIAEALTVTPSSISMALNIVDAVTPDLARAIGPALGIGRPRWEALAAAISDTGTDPETLVDPAEVAYGVALAKQEDDPSRAAFDAVMAKLAEPRGSTNPRTTATRRSSDKTWRQITFADGLRGEVRRSGKTVRLDVETGPFADWLEAEAETVLPELYARYRRSVEESQ